MTSCAPAGEFSRREVRSLLSLGVKLDTGDRIASEITFVQKESKQKIEKLRFATDSHIGLEILHLFILDMLGRDTAVARIFQSKASEDFEHSQVVSRRSKSSAW